jgi:hypothetical protein
VDARLTFDIVRQDERESFASRPAWPIFRRALRSWHNRPDVSDTLA